MTPPHPLVREARSPPPAPVAGAVDDALTLGEVVDKPECRMLSGRGRAGNTAIIVVPSSAGTRFEVLDGNGTVFGDALPFVPHRLNVGKRGDGTVVAGVGDLRLNSRVYREPDTPEPVRIYVGGQVAYETSKAWNFGVAADGSSFWVHEPMAGAASRLLVRNLDLGNETHFDLDTYYAPASAHDRGYVARYATGSEEIVFEKGGDQGRGLYRFYSVAGEEVRAIRVGPNHPFIAGAGADIVVDDDAFMTHMVSSEEGYFAYPPGEIAKTGTPEPWRIVRRQFGYGDEPGAVDEWSLDIELAGYGGTMIMSDDGRWLGLKAWDFVLLDAETGETVFEFPEVDKTAQLARLASVLEHGATVANVGAVTSYSFRDEQLLLYRRMGSTRSCSARASSGLDDYYECVADLRRRGLYRTVLDVFDLNSIDLDSQPDFRVDYDERNQCAMGEFPLRGLQVHDGRLTFLTNQR